MAMTQIKYPAVTMTVDEPRFALYIPHKRPFSSSWHKVNASELEKRQFARGNMMGELVHNLVFALMGNVLGTGHESS
jgi:hypothetical protein